MAKESKCDLSREQDVKALKIERSLLSQAYFQLKKQTKELERSEKNFRTIFNTGTDGILLAELVRKKFVLGNQAICRMTGYSSKEITKLGVLDIHPKKDIPYVLDQFRRQAKGEFSLAKDIPIKRKDGTVFYADVNSNRIELGGKNFLLGFFRDMTDKRRIEEALIKSEEKYRLLAEKSRDGIAIVSLNGKMKYVNSFLANLLGYKINEIIGQNVLKFTHPDFRKATISVIKQFQKGQKSMRFEAADITKDGRRIDIEDNISLIDYQGEKCGLVLVRDVTERKRIEEALHASELQIRTISNNLPAAMIYQVIVLKDGSKKLTYVSDLVKEFYGITPAEAMKNTNFVYQGIPKNDLRQFCIDEQKAIKSLSTFKREIKLVSPSGKTRWVYFVSTPTILGRGKVCWNGIEFDITEQKKTEEALLMSEKRYRGIFETSRDAIMTLDPPLWKFTSGNLETIKMFRTGNEAKFLSYPPWELSPKLQPDGQNSKIKAKKMIDLAMKKGSNLFTWTHKRINGENFLAEVFLSKVVLGEKVFLQAIVRDVTERQRLETLLRDNEGILSETSKLGKIGGWRIDLEQNLLYWTREVFAIHEVPVDFHPTVEKAINFYDEESKIIIRKAVQAAIKSGKSFDVELGVITARGRHIQVRSLGLVKKNKQGKPQFVYGAFQDITERKKAEMELSRLNRVLQLISSSNQVLIHATSEAELLQEVCRLIVKIGGYRMTWIGFAEQNEEKTIRPVAKAGFDVGYLEKIKVTWANNRFGQGPSGMAIRTGKPFVAQNIIKDSHMSPWRHEAVQRGYKASIALPLISSGKTLGMLAIYAKDSEAFDKKEIMALSELAGDLSFGINALRIKDQQKINQEKLVQSETSFRAIYEQSPVAIFKVSLDGHFLDANTATTKMLGYSEDELRKLTFADITHPREAGRDVAVLKKMAAGKLLNYSIEKRYIRKDKKMIHVKIDVALIRDKNKKSLYLLTFADDVTQHHRYEEAIRKSEEKYSNLVESSSDAVVVIQDGIIKYANPAISKIANMMPKEIVGRTMTDFIAPEDKEAVGINYQRRMKGEKVENRYEFSAVDNKGKIVPVETSNSIISFEGRPADMAILRDVSRAKQIDKMKSEFISVASHQLRTPLTGIKWFSQLLIDQKVGKLAPKQVDYIKQIASSNERMIHLINDLIDVSHIETGQKFVVKKKVSDIISLIEVVVRDQKIIAPTRDISIEIENTCPGRVRFKFDYDKIYQALSNLINNAVKYSLAKEKVIVGLKCRKDKVTISVKDFGYGIPASQKSRIFEKFFRGDNIATISAEGTGWGLYIARGLVEAHGGKMWFESTENVGTTFYFTLPKKG